MLSAMTKELKVTERGGSRITLPEGNGDKYLVRLMGWDEGAKVVHGSSADYPVSAIKRDFPEAFPKGTRMRANHDGICEAGGDIRRIMAKTTDTPFAKEDGMYAHMIVAEQWSPMVKEFGDVIGLSISAAGELDNRNDPEHEDYDPDFPKTISRFYSAEESPYNSVDFVEAPGADGRIVLAVEAAKKQFLEMNVREAATFGSPVFDDKPTAVQPEENKKEIRMDKELEERLDAMENTIVERIAERLAPAPAPAEVPDLVAVERAASDAGLPTEFRDDVVEAAREGKDWNAVLEGRKSLLEKLLSGRPAPVSEGDDVHYAGGTVFGEQNATEGLSDKSLEGYLDEVEKEFS